VPRLWTQNIETHRREVRDAIVDTAESLVAELGLRAVTMGQIAERTGIGRATLYKYFPDVEAILVAWHDRHVTGHLEHLAAARDEATEARERLQTVLTGYALHAYARAHQPHAADLAALVHRDEHVAQAQQQLHNLFRGVLTEAAGAGDIRRDVAPAELAEYCIHALNAAARLPTKAATRRLVDVTLAGLQAGT
jgi:AcrR family transcriptional regulator